MHPVSRICAVVDSFDAMTAFRPFKERTMSIEEAMNVIVSETPQKYDRAVVDAWIGLLQATENLIAPVRAAGDKSRRSFERFSINCPARLHVLDRQVAGWHERLGVQAMVHNISRGGLGMLSQTPIDPGEHVRVYLLGKASLSQLNEGVTVRCREYRDGWFEVGMTCVPLLAEPHVDSLVALNAAA
jgi:hypothetical protein